ncbi:MAG: hypothetical protein HGB32_04785 [Geobacteraceae bacterium]|nr:hypothetical protein [Geobacteraceae bacterium]NTW79445.1 hypothetical protein [Geobacteraceae bacterium]
MRYRLLFVLLIASYVVCIVPFASYMKRRPVAVKLGYVPSAEVLRIVVGDQKLLVAHAAIVKVLVYFGTLLDKHPDSKLVLPAEYLNMYKTLQTSVKLDPYNNDAYYFAQAAFTWEVGRAQEVNLMLDYGMKYRTWDYMLPFYAGFNAAYFLKLYEPAASYMKKAAEISGNPLLTNLAARYFFESDKSELGIKFLEMMEKSTKDEQVRKLYHVRRTALVAISTIQGAVNRFKEQNGRLPERLDEIVEQNILKQLPVDPYGGRFYLDNSGSVKTTSKFAFGEHK